MPVCLHELLIIFFLKTIELCIFLHQLEILKNFYLCFPICLFGIILIPADLHLNFYNLKFCAKETNLVLNISYASQKY